MHAVVARSTFPSQNVQNTPLSDHFWKLRCRKSARRCGAKSTFPSENVQNTPCSDHFWKLRCRKVHAVVARSTFPSQNVQNTSLSDHFLEVEMSKKCTPLWREAHFEVKIYKTHHCRTTCGTLMHSSICTSLQAQPKSLARCCVEKNTLRRHRAGDASEGCARFRQVFAVCCVNTVGAVEVSS